MTDAQQREAARQFFYRWNGKGREDEDARSYWIEILSNIIGVERVTERVDFEKKVIGPDGNSLWEIEKRLSLFQRHCLQQLLLARPHARTKSPNRETSPGHLRRPGPVPRFLPG